MLLSKEAALDILPEDYFYADGNSLASLGGTVLYPSAYLYVGEDSWEGLYHPSAVLQVAWIVFRSSPDHVKDSMVAKSDIFHLDVGDSSCHVGGFFFAPDDVGFLTTEELSSTGKIQVDCGSSVLIASPVLSVGDDFLFPVVDDAIEDDLEEFFFPKLL